MAEIVRRMWNYNTNTWNTYAKTQWDREIGWGTAPDKYKPQTPVDQDDIDWSVNGTDTEFYDAFENH